MKNRAGIGALALAACLAAAAYAQTADEERAARYARLLELAEPGPEHGGLSVYAGSWDVEVRMGAGDAAVVYTGTATNRMIAGDRFLCCEIDAEGPSGRVEGALVLGFDRRHGEYTVQSMDSWGTYFVTARGAPGETADRVRLEGTDEDPQMKELGIVKEFAYVLDFRDRDHLVVETFMIDNRTDERRDVKAMEYSFRRPK